MNTTTFIKQNFARFDRKKKNETPKLCSFLEQVEEEEATWLRARKEGLY